MVFHVSYRGKRTSNTMRRIPLHKEAADNKNKREHNKTLALRVKVPTQPYKHAVKDKKAGRVNQRSNMYDI